MKGRTLKEEGDTAAAEEHRALHFATLRPGEAGEKNKVSRVKSQGSYSYN